LLYAYDFQIKNVSYALYVMTHLRTGLGSLKGLKMSATSLYRLGLDRDQLIVSLMMIGFME